MAWIAIGVGGVLLFVATALAVILGWRAYVRRTLLKLVVRAEAVEAAGAALIETAERLATGSDDDLEMFAEDTDSPERHALSEIRMRAQHIADELDHLALPRRLHETAEALADAAFVVATQAGCVGGEDAGMQALDKLGNIDLAAVRTYMAKARGVLGGSCEECGLGETSLYGGGLYL